MEYDHYFRRIFHLCGPLFLVYYLFPKDMWGLGISNKEFIIIIFTLLMIFEAVRLGTGRLFFGLRNYEKKQLSAYAWAAIAITIAFLFFPPIFVICAVVGMGWTDPLIGELRKHWKEAYPVLPIVVYFLIIMGCLQLFSGIPLLVQLFLASLTTVIAILVEYPRLNYVDDDFLMLIIPLIVLTGVYECLIFTGLA